MSALPSIVFYIIPLLSSAGLALSSWQRSTREARPFSYLMIAIAAWSLFHTLSVADPTVEGTLFWAQVQYVGIVAVSPCWLWFALAYANRWERVRQPARALLIIPPILSLAAVLTNQWHQLWWTSVTRDLTRPFVAIAVTRGPLFWIHTAYSYTYVLLGLGVFIYAMLGARLLYRNQARLVIIGALFPVVGNIAHLLGLQVRAVDDPTPFLFGAAGLFMYLAMRNYRLLDLSPIAQREVFEDMPDGMLVLDQQGTIATINLAAARLLNIQPDAWLGRPASELIGGSALAQALHPLLAPDASSATLVVSVGGETDQRVVEARRRPLILGQSNSGVLLLLCDMTERAAIEQQLARRVTELTLLNQIASAANAATQTADLLPRIADQIISAVSWDRIMIGILQPDRMTLQIAVDQATQAGETYAGTYVAEPQFGLIFEIMRAGETRILKRHDSAVAATPTATAMHELGFDTMLVVPLYQRREPLGVLGVGYRSAQAIAAVDMHLYQMVGQLIADAITRARLYDAANEASALKSAFLATVSHELRTPLTSIIGYADMLEHGVFGALPERVAEPLGHVRHSGQMLLRMINDILDFSKMEAGHFTIECYPVDLSTVIRSVAGTLRPQIYERGLELELMLAPELPLVYANSSRLEQVLTNLLANAIKFTERGTITVATTYSNERVHLSVRDTGIGIAPDDLGSLFQPFQQLDNQLTRRFGGTGLGLAISKRLVELMDGALLVTSMPGAGTTFTCELRVAGVEALREMAVNGITA
jgi:signal transduction histidine kinase